MIELSEAECKELESRVMAKLSSDSAETDSATARLFIKISTRAAIMTIREYEKMKAQTPETR